MKKTLIFLFLFPLLLKGQCLTDTIRLDGIPSRDVVAIDDTARCYVACQPCKYSRSWMVPPQDMCLEIGGNPGIVGVLIRDTCNIVNIDTCINLAAPGSLGYVCYNLPSWSIVTLCRPQGDTVTARQWFNGGGNPVPAPIVNTDTLCIPLGVPNGYVPQNVWIDVLTLRQVPVGQLVKGRMYIKRNRTIYVVY